MSVWTHVTGCVRIDGLAVYIGKPVEDIVGRAFGKTCAYDDGRDAWDGCTVPCGSEGSIQYAPVRTGDDSSLSWGLVYIWGDLRNYQSADEIVTWLQGAINILKVNGIWVRGLSVFIEIEGREQYSLIADDYGNIKASLVERWNTRPVEDAQAAEITKLEHIIDEKEEEIARLVTVVEKYANKANWEQSGEFTGRNDAEIVFLNNLWAGSVHGYAIAKNALDTSHKLLKGD